MAKSKHCSSIMGQRIYKSEKLVNQLMKINKTN